MSPITIAIIGAGSRGLFSYAPYALEHPNEAKIVAVAEPRTWYREEAARRHGIGAPAQFSDWRELLQGPQIADAVIIATPDRDHTAPAIAALERGYHVLLEKPMATTEAECRQIVAAVKKHDRFLAVCHVMRYSPFFREVKRVIDGGILGQVRTVRHIEQVAFWHYAHSYVRGNWRNSEDSSPMILAKCCHDMDILLFLLEKHCIRLSSFGSLEHFTPRQRPANAAERCLDCPLAGGECPYSATKFYMDWYNRGEREWPLNVITSDITPAGIEKALREGPYGRCVYACDNDVVDSQVASLEFEGGVQVAFTMTAFNHDNRRKVEILGSHGELHGNENSISVTDFRTGHTEHRDMRSTENSVRGGHMGGDAGIMRDFLGALREKDPSKITSSADMSLESHLMAFAAERSRLKGTVEVITRD